MNKLPVEIKEDVLLMMVSDQLKSTSISIITELRTVSRSFNEAIQTQSFYRILTQRTFGKIYPIATCPIVSFLCHYRMSKIFVVEMRYPKYFWTFSMAVEFIINHLTNDNASTLLLDRAIRLNFLQHHPQYTESDFERLIEYWNTQTQWKAAREQLDGQPLFMDLIKFVPSVLKVVKRESCGKITYQFNSCSYKVSTIKIEGF